MSDFFQFQRKHNKIPLNSPVLTKVAGSEPATLLKTEIFFLYFLSDSSTFLPTSRNNFLVVASVFFSEIQEKVFSLSLSLSVYTYVIYNYIYVFMYICFTLEKFVLLTSFPHSPLFHLWLKQIFLFLYIIFLEITFIVLHYIYIYNT